MRRKALVIGIDDYPKSPLHCCVNDADEMTNLLERNADGTKNFDVVKKCNIASKDEMLALIGELFSGDDDIALLYFSGHGARENNVEYICACDTTGFTPGVRLSDILEIVTNSKCKNKIVILDSCFSGGMGDIPLFANDAAVLVKGTTILSACKNTEGAVEMKGHGLFTRLLIEALKGGAADLCGNISPGSIYAYVDKALGSWEQRPLFKTNVQEFISLRKAKAPIDLQDLQKLKDIFHTSSEIVLNPSFEYTNTLENKSLLKEPYADESNVKLFKLLQRLERVGLVVPVGAEHMYYAAMDSKSCKLTPLGEYYLSLSKAGRI